MTTCLHDPTCLYNFYMPIFFGAKYTPSMVKFRRFFSAPARQVLLSHGVKVVPAATFRTAGQGILKAILGALYAAWLLRFQCGRTIFCLTTTCLAMMSDLSNDLFTVPWNSGFH